MRLRNITDAKKILGCHPDKVIMDPARHRGQWSSLFGNDSPIFLEIGMGKGQFICGMSDQLPGVNFLGLEKYDSVLLRALQKLEQNPRQNIMLIRGEAENVESYFAPFEIGRIYLNFPDPWPRRRDTKKRLTHIGFLEKYRAVLAPQAEIQFKTDDRGLFDFTLQHMKEHCLKLDRIVMDLHADEPTDNVRTEYETSKSGAGAKIYQLVCRFN
jgi:tRNA (guanine-N7-)-methyltransferase